MKSECTRQILVPFGLDEMREELACYVTWYNDQRPHQALAGRVPTEVHLGSVTRSGKFEPRPRWAVDDQTERAAHIRLDVKFVEGRRHLPIVQLTRAA